MEAQQAKKKKHYTPQQALKKVQLYCTYQERYQQEVRDKLYEWGLFPDAVENIIAQLIIENFLNEERFAKAYAGGKFRIKKWGRIKIKLELKKRNLSEYCIRKGLEEIDNESYYQIAEQLIKKKWQETSGENKMAKDVKVARYVISRGFEQDLVWDIIKSKENEKQK